MRCGEYVSSTMRHGKCAILCGKCNSAGSIYVIRYDKHGAISSDEQCAIKCGKNGAVRMGPYERCD